MEQNISINDVNQKILAQDERIAKFLKGKMTQDEESAFMTDLKSDEELRSKAIVMARLSKGLSEVGHMQDQEIIDAFLTIDKPTVENIARNTVKGNISTEKEKKAPVVSMRKLSTWMSVAACLALIVWFGVGEYNNRQLINLANESYGVFGVEGLAKGDNTLSASEQKLATLFDNVKEGKDLDATIHDLEICWEISTMEIYNDYTNYSAEIGWNLAMAYLKIGEKNEAIKVLQYMGVIYKEQTIVVSQIKQILDALENHH